MTEGSGFLENWSLEVKFLDDVSWSEVEIILDDSNKVVIGESLLDCSIGIDVDGEWVSKTNGI